MPDISLNLHQGFPQGFDNALLFARGRVSEAAGSSAELICAIHLFTEGRLESLDRAGREVGNAVLRVGTGWTALESVFF